MAKLADMEELLFQIRNKDLVDYMREALACYNTSAYRGCIVMSYIALFDDIREKLKELSKVDSVAKTLSLEIEKRASDQDVFETYMADQVKAKGFITTAEHERLETIRKMRNKAAHPSGVHASAEEARFVYRTVISEFLSQQLLKTTHAVDVIISRLPNKNIFPTLNISEIKYIVADEISEIHQAAYPYLTKQLLEAFLGNDTNTQKNSERFFVGLAALQDDEIRSHLQKKVIQKNCDDDQYGNLFSKMVAVDGKILKGLDKKTTLRMKALLIHVVEKSSAEVVTKLSHPTQVLGSMIRELGEKRVVRGYEELVTKVISLHPYSYILLEALETNSCIAPKVVEIWKKKAGSHTFSTSNVFANSLQEIDGFAEKIMSDRDAFELVVKINEAAEWGAHSSMSAILHKFEDAPNLSTMAKGYISKNPKKSKEYVTSKLDVSAFDDFFLKNFQKEVKQE